MYWHYHHWAHGSHMSGSVTGLPTIFATVVIGTIAAYIAWRQYEVAHANLKLGLFDKRYAIFEQTWQIFSAAATKGAREKMYGLATPFNNLLPSASFLFGKSIEKYLKEASKKWTELRAAEAEAGGHGIDVVANAEQVRVLTNWFFEQADHGVKAQFGPYLEFEKWK